MMNSLHLPDGGCSFGTVVCRNGMNVLDASLCEALNKRQWVEQLIVRFILKIYSIDETLRSLCCQVSFKYGDMSKIISMSDNDTRRAE